LIIQKVYLETTIFNYFFDQDRDGHQASVEIFEAIGRGEYEGYTSEYVTRELEKAPDPKRKNMIALINKYQLHLLPINAEVNRLSELYIAEHVIPAKFDTDAAHIACATVNNLDILLSYNYHHINSLRVMFLVDKINLFNRYKTIIITSPLVLLENNEN
jgi:predicted nucleic acid-binding protein